MSRSYGVVAENKEYRRKDRRRAKKEGKDYHSGRVDLWIGVGEDESIIQAKQCWFLGTPKTESDFADKCRCCLKEAAGNVLEDYSEGEALLGMAFVAPLFRLDDPDVEKKLRALQRVGLSKEKVNTQAIAWSFPMIEKMPVYRGSGYTC